MSTKTLLEDANVIPGPSRTPGEVLGFLFTQSVLSFTISTRAGVPVPTTSVPVNTGVDPPAPGAVKSASEVHVVDAAATFGENVIRTDSVISIRTITAQIARNGLDIGALTPNFRPPSRWSR